MGVPKIRNAGHTWPSTERAEARANRIAPLFQLEPSTFAEAATTGQEVALSPFDIIDTLFASNKDVLFEHVEEDRHFLLSLVKDQAQSDSLRELFDADHDAVEKSRLGQPWRSQTKGNLVVLAARLSDSNATQGIAVFQKKTYLDMYERDLVYRYQIELCNFYVSPRARVKGVAYSLATAIALQIDEDVRSIRRAIGKADRIYKNKVRVSFQIGGEPYTVGGARLARQIVEAMTYSIEREFSTEEINRFCDGETLEEDFTLMYTFFDEVGDPPEKLDYSIIEMPDKNMWDGVKVSSAP